MLPDKDILLDDRMIDMINVIWKRASDDSDRQKPVKPELNDEQRERHARIPALQAAWDQYMTMWNITNGD